MRSDMDHTVLPANYTMPAFTTQPQSINAVWLVLIYCPTEGRRLSACAGRNLLEGVRAGRCRTLEHNDGLPVSYLSWSSAGRVPTASGMSCHEYVQNVKQAFCSSCN